jgi:type I restriction enzyme S subunit
VTHRPYPSTKDSGIEWLGEVPEHWDVVGFRRVVDIAGGQVDPENEQYSSMNLIAPNHIESGTGRLLGMETAAEQSAESGKYLCKAGDVIYSKIRPALRKACIAPEDCLCSADMYPLSGRQNLSNRYLFWTILSEEFSAYTILESDRVAMPKVNRESLNALPLLVPPLAEQQAIAAFLDRETAKIDGLVAEQERLIALLTEKRQAVISHAVTRGLDPSVPLKDSGVEWLGQVPEHWVVAKFGRIAFMQEGPGLRNWQFTDDGVRVICVTNITESGIDFSRYEKFISVEEYRTSYRHFWVYADISGSCRENRVKFEAT